MTIATLDRPSIAVATELARGRGGGGPASKRTVVAYGFWIFILSDMVMFSALFAAYAVLRGNTAGGLNIRAWRGLSVHRGNGICPYGGDRRRALA